jgi:hypothetical protein
MCHCKNNIIEVAATADTATVNSTDTAKRSLENQENIVRVSSTNSPVPEHLRGMRIQDMTCINGMTRIWRYD